MSTLRTETAEGVRTIVLSRPDEYNTITPELRDDLAAAIDEADADDAVRVILLRAEGKAFCAGYGLGWSTEMQAAEAAADRVSMIEVDRQLDVLPVVEGHGRSPGASCVEEDGSEARPSWRQCGSFRHACTVPLRTDRADLSGSTEDSSEKTGNLGAEAERTVIESPGSAGMLSALARQAPPP